MQKYLLIFALIQDTRMVTLKSLKVHPDFMCQTANSKSTYLVSLFKQESFLLTTIFDVTVNPE